MKRLIKWLLLFTFAVVILLIVVLFNPQLIKSPIEHLLSKNTGYAISLNGSLDLNLGKISSVQATDIQITNPAYEKQAKLASIKSLRLDIETHSLWSEALVFNQISIQGTRVLLDTNEAGASNWVVPKKTAAKDAPAKSARTIHIKNFQVKNSQLHYRQHAVGEDQLLKIASLVQTEAQDGLLKIVMDATFNDRPATFNGHIGPFANIIKGRDVSFDGKGRLGPINISGQGLIDDLVHPRQPEFDIKMIGPNIKDVTAMLKIDDLGTGPFDLKAKGHETNGHYFAVIDGKIGNVTLQATALSQQAGNFDDLKVKLDASGPNLAAVAKAFGKKGWPQQAFSMHGEVQRKKSDLEISQLKLDIGGANLLLNAKLTNFPRFDPTEVSLSVKGDEVAHFREMLGIKGVATGAFSLQGELGLSDGGVRQLTVDFESSLGKALVSGELGAAPSYDDTRLHLKVLGHNAHQFMSVFNVNLLPEETFTLESDLRISAVGKSSTRHFTLNNLNIELADVKLVGQVAFDAQKPLKSGKGSLLISSTDIANLARFPKLSQPVSLLVPGQPFHLKGDLLLVNHDWEMKNLKGAIGNTSVQLSGVLKPALKWANSNLQFNVNGPGLQLLLNNISPSSHLQEAFTGGGNLQINNDQLQLNGFSFESGNTTANINASMAWPVISNGDIVFNLDSQGADISRFVPKIGSFKPAKIAFKLTTSGKRRQSQIHFDNLTATAGSLQLSLNGSLDQTTRRNSNANIVLESRNISDLGQYDGKPLPVQGLHAQADVHGSLGHFKLEQLQAKFGKSDLSGTLEVLLTGPRPEFLLDSTSTLLDFSTGQSSTQMATKTPTTTASEKRLIPDLPLPLASLSAFDATINASAKQLRFKGDSLKNITLKTSIKDGALSTPTLTFEGQRGDVSLTLTITPTKKDEAKVTLDARTGGFIFNSLGHAGVDADKVPAMDLLLKVHGEGGNLQQLVSTASGSFKAGSKGGTLAGVDLGFLDNFILDQIFSLILPKSKQHENTKLTCAAAVFELEDGIAKTNPAFAFTTNKITLVSKGSLDLNTERLSFGFKATPNNVLNISAGEFLNSFIVVGGTLSKPEVGLDPTKVLIQGGAAIGTAGISLLAKGLLDRFGNTIPVCESMREQLKQDFEPDN